MKKFTKTRNYRLNTSEAAFYQGVGNVLYCLKTLQETKI